MSTVTIELKQEGVVAPEGFALIQWISTQPPSASSPSTFRPLFLIRNVLGVESFERVATVQDYVAYAWNELKYFEARGAGGDALLGNCAPGDQLQAFQPGTTSPPGAWIQAEAPYADATFSLAALESLSSGTAPQVMVGGYVLLPGHSFTDEDVGRWVVLTGFASSSYDRAFQILSYVGDVAKVDATVISGGISTNETGATWAFKRWRISQATSPGAEPRYFPTLARNYPWQVTRGVALQASGPSLYALRADVAAPLYRDLRMTSVLPSVGAADARAATVRAAVSALQVAADVLPPAFPPEFLATQTYDYPPP